MGYCTKKSGRIIKIFFFLALFFNPYLRQHYELRDVKYWEPDSPAFKKIEASDYKKGPLKMGLKVGLIARGGDNQNQLRFHLYPLFLWNTWGKQKQIREWEKELKKESLFYLGVEEYVRPREDYNRELTRIRNSFPERFGERFDFLKFNYTFFIVEVFAILVGSLVYLIFCALIQKFSY